MKSIGFIGLGIMGKPMAANLIAAGYEVFLKTRRDVPPDLVSAGGTPCDRAREVGPAAAPPPAPPRKDGEGRRVPLPVLTGRS